MSFLEELQLTIEITSMTSLTDTTRLPVCQCAFFRKLIHLWAITLISMDMFSYSEQNVLSLFYLKLNSDELGKRPTVLTA